jgi:uncharacterized protein YecE (DUF72 family)
MEWLIGCSGFHYKEWKGVFYPEKLAQSKWFDYYSQHFNTLELNVTFYRFPQLNTLQNWYSKSHEQFRFSVKAPRLITHYKQFSDSRQLLSDFYGTIREGLKEKLACVLFQLPPQAVYSEERLQRIIESMDPSFINVVEFRDPGWWNSHVYTQFARHNIVFCGINHPTLPQEAIINNPVVYYRFHGVPRLYHSAYKQQTLQKLADEIKSNDRVKQACIYFNNTAEVSAINNARQLQEYCGYGN